MRNCNKGLHYWEGGEPLTWWVSTWVNPSCPASVSRGRILNASKSWVEGGRLHVSPVSLGGVSAGGHP